MLSEGVSESEHEVVLFLEVEQLIADIEEEALCEAHLKVGKLIGGTSLFRAYEVIGDT